MSEILISIILVFDYICLRNFIVVGIDIGL